MQDTLNNIKEELASSVYFPESCMQTLEEIKNIRDIAFDSKLEPEKLREALRKSLEIHQDTDAKIKYYQGRISDLEQQFKYYIETSSNHNYKPTNIFVPDEELIEAKSKAEDENNYLKKKFNSLAKQYKILDEKYRKLQGKSSFNEIDGNISNQVKLLQAELDNRNKELSEMRNKSHRNESDLSKFKIAYAALKKKYDAQNSEITKPVNCEITKPVYCEITKPVNCELKFLNNESMNELETVEEIGYGATGKVLKVAKKKYYALKILNANTISIENLRKLMKESEILNMLDHPNILKSLGFYYSGKKPPAILLEYCCMNLNNAVKNKALSNVQIACSIYQIAEGMKYIHFRNILHRDLKPSNVLIDDDGTIKICDFDNSKLMTPDELSLTAGIGTNKFMAPEMIAESDSYDEKVDVYSFGTLVFFILSGGEMPCIKIPQILSGEKAEIPLSFTQFARNLINDCWNFDPKNRPSFNDICKLMPIHCHELLNLSDGENKNVQEFIINHQKRMPIYES